MSVAAIASGLMESFPRPQENIRLTFGDICSAEVIVNELASLQGPVDVCTWFEGPQGVRMKGAEFMKKELFAPLYLLKHDAKLWLYSLKGWDFIKKAADLPTSTPLGDAINRVNRAALECISCASFFNYCFKDPKEALYSYVNAELPKKTEFFEISSTKRKQIKSVDEFFGGQSTLFDCIGEHDVSIAYSAMQYVEGYYLIRESVRRGLLNGQKLIQIAFVLPNDEGKYYSGLQNEIEKLLKLDFGNDLNDVEIIISFRFFRYGDSLCSRPYIDSGSKLDVNEVPAYFDYLRTLPVFLRDEIHNINGWRQE